MEVPAQTMGIKKVTSKVKLNDDEDKLNSSNSEEKEGEGEEEEEESDDSNSVKDIINTADDAWRFYTEAQCEKILDQDPFNM